VLETLRKFGEISVDQNQSQNEPNFRTLGNISEGEKIEIIKTGFQLTVEGKIFLKKDYEGADGIYSLFHSRGYRIKYESIRRTKLYLKLKE